ncbi:hypothetical protein [Aeoliella mucimassa]|uniref:hypothetical protein n=1 Tax=Aeoliella mucimassa TaxID=2527972 RepID=UPI00119E9FE9|nr:hypothetical protein [Aeoliella mucimassa]
MDAEPAAKVPFNSESFPMARPLLPQGRLQDMNNKKQKRAEIHAAEDSESNPPARQSTGAGAKPNETQDQPWNAEQHEERSDHVTGPAEVPANTECTKAAER